MNANQMVKNAREYFCRCAHGKVAGRIFCDSLTKAGTILDIGELDKSTLRDQFNTILAHQR